MQDYPIPHCSTHACGHLTLTCVFVQRVKMGAVKEAKEAEKLKEEEKNTLQQNLDNFQNQLREAKLALQVRRVCSLWVTRNNCHWYFECKCSSSFGLR